MADYLQLIDRHNLQNSAAHLPYANVRSLVCGFRRRCVDDHQMRQIQYEIARGMDEGAVGLSTGLDYIVQCHATTEALIAACSAMASCGAPYVTHVRYKRGLVPALREAVEIGRRAGVPVHVSHLKATSPDETERVLDFIEQASREVALWTPGRAFPAG